MAGKDWVGSLVLKFRDEASGPLSKTRGEVTNTHSALGKLGTIAAVGGGAIAAIGLAALTAGAKFSLWGADVQKGYMQLGSLVGGMDRAQNIMNVAAAATGHLANKQELLPSIMRLVNMGLISNEAETSNVIGLTGKMAGIAATTVPVAVEALTNALMSGRTQGLRPFGIDTDKLKDRMGELSAQFPDASQKEIMWMAIQEQMGAIVSKSSGQVVNFSLSMQALKNTMIDTAADMAMRLVPALDLMAPAIMALMPAITGAANMFMSQFLPIFTNVAIAISSAINTIVNSGVLNQLAQMLAAVVSVVGNVLNQLIPVIATVFATIVNALAPAFVMFMGVITQVVNIALAILIPILNLLAAVIVAIAPGVTALVGAFLQFWNILAAALIPVLLQFFAVLTPIIVSLVQQFNPILVMIGQVLVALAPIIGQLLCVALTFFMNILVALQPAMSAIIGAFVTIATAVFQVIMALLPLVTVLITALQPVLNVIVMVITQLALTFASLVQAIAPLIAQLIVSLTPVLTQLIMIIIQLVSQILMAFAPILLQLAIMFGQLCAAIVPVVTILITALTPILTSLLNIFASLIAQLLAMLLPVLMQLVGAFVQLMASLGPLIASLIAQLAPILVQLLTIFAQLAGTLLMALVPILAQLAIMFLQILTAILPVVGVLVAALAPVLVQLLGIFVSIVSNLLAMFLPVIIQLSNVFVQLVMAIAPLVTMLISALAPILAQLITAFGTLVAQLLLALAPILLQIAGIFAQLLLAILPLLPPLVDVLKPVLQILLAIFIALIAPIIDLLVKALGPLAPFLQAILTPAVWALKLAFGAIETVINVIKWVFDNVLKPALDTVLGWITGNTGDIKGKWDWLLGEASRIWNTIVSTIENLIAGVKQWIIDRWNEISTFLTNLWNAINITASNLWTNIVTTVENLIAGAKQWIIDRWNEISTFLTNLWNAIGTTASNLWTIIVTNIENLIAGAKQWIMDRWNEISTFLTNTWNNIQTEAGKIWEAITKKIEEFVGGVKKFIKEHWDDILKNTTDIWNRVKNAIRDVLNGAIKVLNSFLNGIVTGFNWIAEKLGISVRLVYQPIGEIPAFAEGGTMQRTGYAVVGEKGPELVTLPRGAHVTPNDETFPGMFGMPGPLGMGGSFWDEAKRVISNIGSWISEKFDYLKTQVALGTDWFIDKAFEVFKIMKPPWMGFLANFADPIYNMVRDALKNVVNDWILGIQEEIAQEEARRNPPLSSGVGMQWFGLIQKYFPRDQWVNAFRVMLGESQGNPGAIGDHGSSIGLFQIRWDMPGRPSKQQLLDPDFNVRTAGNIFRNEGWRPWTAAMWLGLVPGVRPAGNLPDWIKNANPFAPAAPAGRPVNAYWGSHGYPAPTSGVISNTAHAGYSAIDIASGVGTAIVAVADAIVNQAGWSNVGYGNMILLKHFDGLSSLYAHLSRILVSVGQRVGRGQKIGEMGSTGNSTGPHLHFEIRSAAKGANFLATTPELMMVGDDGPEWVNVIPMKGAARRGYKGGGTSINYILNYTAVRKEPGKKDAVRAMRELEMLARLKSS